VEQFLNDVLISLWQDVSGFVGFQKPEHVTSGSRLKGITMKMLRDAAVDQGPYDVGERNCHHCALQVYNYCAQEFGQRLIGESEMPNAHLIGVAKMLSWFGVDVAASADEGKQPSQGSQRLRTRFVQNSFAVEDSLMVLKYRGIVDSNVSTCKMCAMLPPGLEDKTWIQRWGGQLRESHAALVVFSEAYKEKCKKGPESDVMKEAALLISRVQQDEHFRLYALDPELASEDVNQFRACLSDMLPNKNYDKWRDFVTSHGVQAGEFRATERPQLPPSKGTSGFISSSRALAQFLLTSFALDDELILQQYRDTVDTGAFGWQTYPPIEQGPSRIQQWQAQLSCCQGILILFTKAYRASYARDSDLMLEARAFWNRMEEDPSFKVFVLDNERPGQAPQGLRFALQDGEQQLNLENLRAFHESSLASG